MTPRLTSSNRKLRTSAIAAMVAVSTVFTAVTPAFADTPYNTTNSTKSEANADQPAGLNIADGSILDMKNAKVTSEAALKKATDSVADAIIGYGVASDVDMNKVFQDYRAEKEGKPVTEAPLNDTEQGVLTALKAEFAKITATLKQAAMNQADASATLTAALQADKRASQKYAEIVKHYAGLSAADRAAANTLIKAVNNADKTGKDPKTSTSVLPVIPLLNTKTAVTPDNAIAVAVAVRKHQINIWAPDADHNASDYVDRDYAAALENLINNPLIRDLLKTFEDNEAILIGTQKSDIIPLQMFMDRSRAQVLVLRILQAKYAVAIRMRDLYENDRSTAADKKMIVKDAYYDAMYDKQNNLDSALRRERTRLVDADIAAFKLYKGWQADLGNSADQEDTKTDQERRAYENYRNSEAGRTFNDIANDMNWQTVLERAQVIDRDTFLAAAEKAEAKKAAEKSAQNEAEQIELTRKLNGQVEAAVTQGNNDRVAFTKALKELEEQNAQFSKSQDKFADVLDKILNRPDQQPPADTKDPEGSKGHDNEGEFPFVPLAIAGVVMAIIAAIAGNFPVLLAALPKI